MRLCFRIDRVASIEKVAGSTGLNTGVLSAAFHKYAYESVRAEEARRACPEASRRGEWYSILPENTSPYL
jgi:hypothetical protein